MTIYSINSIHNRVIKRRRKQMQTNRKKKKRRKQSLFLGIVICFALWPKLIYLYNIGSGCVLITAMPHCMIGLGT